KVESDDSGTTLLQPGCIFDYCGLRWKKHSYPAASLPSGLPTLWGTARMLRKTKPAHCGYLKSFKHSPARLSVGMEIASPNFLATRFWRNFQVPIWQCAPPWP